jgi:hypothetical protein
MYYTPVFFGASVRNDEKLKIIGVLVVIQRFTSHIKGGSVTAA